MAYFYEHRARLQRHIHRKGTGAEEEECEGEHTQKEVHLSATCSAASAQTGFERKERQHYPGKRGPLRVETYDEKKARGYLCERLYAHNQIGERRRLGGVRAFFQLLQAQVQKV